MPYDCPVKKFISCKLSTESNITVIDMENIGHVTAQLKYFFLYSDSETQINTLYYLDRVNKA